ncbi:MAG: PAS domain S-box protein, partial [Bacteroidota bacterium]|nr:PAS domain S-box protein [Bacteroidota bacterium]
VLCLEHTGEKRTWFSDEQAFASMAATLLAQTFTNKERKLAENQLKYREEWERLFAASSNRFVNIHIEEIDSEINRALLEIGKFTDVDRSYIFQFVDDGKKMNNIFEWCNEGVEPQKDNLQGLPSDIFPWWMGKLNKHENIIIQRVADLPPDAKAERDILQSQNIRSLVVLPMVYANSLIGFLGFDSTKKERTWPEHIVNILKIMGDTFAGILERKRAEEKIHKSEEMFSIIFKKAPYAASLVSIPEQVIEEINETHEWLFGYSREEVVGKRADMLDMCFDPEQRKRIGTLIRQQGFVRNAELTFRTKSHAVIHILLNAEPVQIGGKSFLLTTAQDITERKRAEAELLESEERWSFALEGGGDGVWDWNTQTNQVFFSRRWKEMLGFEEHEIGNTLDDWSRRVHPDDIGWVMEETQKHFRGETPVYVSEHRVSCKDGTYKWILGRGKVISWNGDGKPLRVVGTHTDITERKQMENALRESEEKYKTIVENTHDLIYTCTVDGTITFINPNVAQYGFTQDDIIGHNIIEFIHPDDIERVMIDFEKMIKTGIEFTTEGRLLKKDGSFIYAEEIHKITWVDGKPAQLTGVIRDITERKLAELDLQESERKISTLIGNLPGMAYRCANDRDWTMEYVSPGFYELTGYQPEDLIDNNKLSFNDLIDENYREQLWDKWQEVLRDKKNIPG